MTCRDEHACMLTDRFHKENASVYNMIINNRKGRNNTTKEYIMYDTFT